VSLCILNVVNKQYQKYIPFYVFFSLKLYPTYGIKVISLDEMNKKYVEIIKELEEMGDFVLIEDRKQFNRNEIKSYRWLQDKKLFDGYDYGYIGDIDILLCEEDIPLLEQHLHHSNDEGLCYSNSVRPNSKRMSGLHFFHVDTYYEKMESCILKYKKMLFDGKLKNRKNEELLYQMINEVGLGVSTKWFRPHHGLHLRLWQKSNPNLTRVLSDDDYCRYFRYFLKIENDDLFQKIFRVTPLEEITQMKIHLTKLCKECYL